MIIKNNFNQTSLSSEVSAVSVDRNNNKINTDISVIDEHLLAVYINDILAMELVCSPTNMIEMVIGRLITEGIVSGKEDIEQIYLCESGSRIKVFLDENISFRNNEIDKIESCCSDNRIFIAHNRQLKKVEGCEVKSEWIFTLADIFSKGTRLHDLTHATHSCILAKKDKPLFVAEDIGRHNAIDKAIGMAVCAGEPLCDAILFTSGRVPVDMMKKVINANVGAIISNTVPTAESIKMAKDYGVTLVGSARKDKYNLFALKE